MNFTRNSGGLRALSGSRWRWARFVALGLLLLPQPLYSATIQVSGGCTLVDAIDAANTNAPVGGCPAGAAGPDTVELTGNVSLSVMNNLDSYYGQPTGLPEVTSDITIEGGGFTIERDAAALDLFRIFALTPAGTLTLNDATVSNGNGVAYGGAIFSPYGSTLSLTGSTVSGNYASFSGGGIWSNATLTVTTSDISDNHADSAGGGIFTSTAGTLSITGSTLSANYAVFGGGFEDFGQPTTTVTESTVSGNSAVYGGGFITHYAMIMTNSTVSGNSATRGGGLVDYGALTLVHSTITGNSANTAGGIDSDPDAGYTTILVGSIVADNVGGNCYRDPTTDGGSNFDDDGSCTGAAPITPGTDFDTTLSNNGGPTRTHALLADSVAQNTAGVCGLTTDQRGVARSDGLCDSGSFEIGESGACCTDGPITESECIEVTEDACDQAGPQGGLFLGPGTRCADVVSCEGLLVTMDSMSAEAVAEGVRISWSTAMEADTVGFQVLRESASSREKAAIAVGSFTYATGDHLTGSSYELLDDSPAARRAKVYYVEDVDIYGKVTRHGPIVVDRHERQGRTRRASER